MPKSSWFRFCLRHISVALIACVLTLLFVSGFTLSLSFINPVERAFENFRMTDVFYEIDYQEASKDTSDIITLVDMSDLFSRTRLAEVIGEIDSLEPAVMGVDVVFDGLREDSLGNERLIETVCSTSSPIIWAYKLTDWDDEEMRFTNSHHSFFVDLGVDVDEGYTNVHRDVNGGTVRSFGIRRETENGTDLSLPARLAVTFTGDTTLLGAQRDCSIRYKSTQFRVIHHDSIAQNADLIRGHIVLLGALNDKRDLHYTPLGHIPGVCIIAYTLQTLLNREMPRDMPRAWAMLLTVFLLWIGNILYTGLKQRMSKSRYWVVQEIGKQDLAMELIGFLYIVLLVGIDYLIFVKTNLYFNTGWTIIGVALLDASRKIFEIVKIKVISKKQKTVTP